MPELKTKDPKRPFDLKPSCYIQDPSPFGFTFELARNNRIFAPHSFLVRMEMKNGNEIRFHYTYGVVRVIGQNMELLFSMTKNHVLDGLRPSDPDDPCRDEIEVTQIVFEDAKDTIDNGH